MAESAAISSFGTLLKLGDGETTEVFTAVAEVKDIKGPGMKLDVHEVTHHGSPNATREFIPTLKDLTEVTFEVSFLPQNATHDAATGLQKLYNDRLKRNFQIVFPDLASTTFQFAAYVTGLELGFPVEGVASGDVTLRPSGAITDVTA
jgi:hypothetical protein